MQIPLPIFSTNGLDGVRSYLAASEAYLDSTQHRRTMAYAFPAIHLECPICKRGGCARWKGYYTRGMQDAALATITPVIVRYGRCTWLKCEFSFLPDFLLPRRRITLPTIAAINEILSSETTTIQSAIDRVVSVNVDAHYLPMSTVRSLLAYLRFCLKFQYVRLTRARRRLRFLLPPERFVTPMFLSMLRVLKLSQADPIGPP
jgi:hypothetical protein